MYRVTILYPHEEGKRFDLDYYVQKHMPMVRSLLGPFGLKSAEVAEGLPRNGAPPPFVVIASMTFDAIEDFQRGIAQHGREINADLPHYTDLKPTLQISRIC
ncbi:EthD family reductase [Polyangium mundeleinium]|uniref:EthD family reductase n=1 Tax=Polyangium mundeleinium TaxID=2995306 RepID=A0ABT5EW45_9BACT|nr:EthD family reductase [Polyangium mundeleinium]MDC0745001.1 EthD family reductase [Polyangium mundeleinium]